MKLIASLLVSLVASVVCETINFKGSVDQVKKQTNQWLIVKSSDGKRIESTTVQKEITDDDDLKVEYSFKDKTDKVLGESSSRLCTESDSEEGMVISLLGSFLNLDLTCPIAKQKGEEGGGVRSGKIVLSENPGEGTKIFFDISIKKGDTAILTLSGYGRATANKN
ncbi:uncharacterized protein [Fopius arisanus]|uniref:Uncharacterized protein n=1 Tax=Fopius arisanus TaxID=64838 RepID=A0A9R1T3W8_9HYME|nr:PREDICTED: uncharacterized protein LOC105266055 [Fopius arisanus]